MRLHLALILIYILSTLACSAQGGALPRCVINPCNNGGTCVIVGDMYECRCPTGFEGRVCDTVVTNLGSTSASTSPTTAKPNTTTQAPTTSVPTTPMPTTPIPTTPAPTTPAPTTPAPTTPAPTTPAPTTPAPTAPAPTTQAPTTPSPTTPAPTTPAPTTPAPTTPAPTTPAPTTPASTTPVPTTPAPTTPIPTTPAPTTPAPTTPAPTTSAPTTQTPTTKAPTPCELFNPCLHGGTCRDGGEPAHFTCLCPPSFTGMVCEYAVTTQAPTTTTTTPAPTTPAPTTPVPTTQAPTTPAPSLVDTLGQVGCRESEVVFMLEHMRGDSRGDVDHEADTVTRLVEEWPITSHGVRVGVLVYDKEIKEHIHLDDYDDDKKGLVDKLENIASQVGDTANANVAEVLEYARRNMYKDPRRGADKVAVVIVHQMSSEAKREFAQAAQNLKSHGITLYALAVDAGAAEKDLLRDHADYYHEYSSFADLENATRNFSLHCH